MADSVQNDPGHFVWLELHTPDLKAGKAFYSELFGWASREIPISETDTYTFFDLDGKTAAAGFETSEEMKAAGVPPHWLLYIGVADADAAAEKVTANGGKMIMGPFEVMGSVKNGIFTAPTGATCALCQLLGDPGLAVKNVTGGLVSADLYSPDAEKAAKFYCDVFGWSQFVGDSPYIHFKVGEAFIAGSMPGFMPPGAPPHWSPYVGVANTDAACDKVKAMGGQVYFGPETMENVGR